MNLSHFPTIFVYSSSPWVWHPVSLHFWHFYLPNTHWTGSFNYISRFLYFKTKSHILPQLITKGLRTTWLSALKHWTHFLVPIFLTSFFSHCCNQDLQKHVEGGKICFCFILQEYSREACWKEFEISSYPTYTCWKQKDKHYCLAPFLVLINSSEGSGISTFGRAVLTSANLI